MQDNLLLPDFSAGRILVIGDVILDKYCYGKAERVSPEAPVQVVNMEDETEKLGGAANVAANINALGMQVVLIGLVGADSEAQVLADLLDKHAIEHDLISVADSPTIVKTRVISHNQQLLRLDREDGFPSAALDEVETAFKRQLDDADIVLFSDYAKGCLCDIENLIAIARAAGKSIFIDPKKTDFTAYAGATVLTPNLKEFSAVVGSCDTQAELESKAADLCASCNLDALLITQGDEGMTLFERNHQAVQYPAEAHEVYDTTGAGDTVISVLASAVAAGSTLAQAAKLANKAAGISVMHLGTATITLQELAGVTTTLGHNSRICQVEDALQAVQAARRQGQTIVMTNGCFDILHMGHIDYLKKAGQLGDCLLVAVNDDDSVRRLKGKQRPVKKLDERLLILAEMRMVDWVVAFSADTPEDLINQVKPDVLVKGGDYKPEDVVGYDTVTVAGGEVMVLDYVDGYSTSATIRKIQEQSS